MYYKGLDDFSAYDNQIKDRYKALFLLNSMRKLGFDSRKIFVDTCLTYTSLEVNIQTLGKFAAFWDGRDVTMISEMENIIKTINQLEDGSNS